MTRKRSSRTVCALLLSTLLSLQSCGPNYLEDRAPHSPFEQAQLELEAGDFLSARALLEPYVAENPNNQKAIGLLAATYAAEVGISIIDIAEKGLEYGASEGDLIPSLVPDATAENLQTVRQARDLVLSVPESERIEDVSLGATIYVTIYSILLITYLSESTQTPTLDELLDVVESLEDAAELASANGIPTEKIDEIRAAIDNQDGATQEEKLESYLEQVRAQGGLVPPSSVEIGG